MNDNGWSRRRFIAAGASLGAATGIGGWFFWRRGQRGPYIEVGSGLGELPRNDVYDVIVIGSGPAGTVVATDLAQRGARTLVLESGLEFDKIGDPAITSLAAVDHVGTPEYPATSTRIRALGGTSNIWTGRCSRLHPLDFESNAYTPAGAEWPIRYSDLMPWYDRAERTLRVSGGSLSRYHAPRSTDLPFPAKVENSGLKDMLSNVGVTLDDSPTSASQHVGGPVRAARDLLPEFMAEPTGSLVSGVTVTRLLTGSDGKITGVEVRDLDRGTRTLRAKAYVIACGAMDSARLLLLSRSEAWPDGIGNHNGMVGRYFNEHPNVSLSGMIEHTWTTLSPQYELARCHQYYNELKKRGLGSALMVFSQSWVFRDDLEDLSGADVLQRLERLVRGELRIGATLEMRPVAENRISLAEEQKDYFGNPIAQLALSFTDDDRRTEEEVKRLIRDIYARLGATDIRELPISWSHHHLGGCRMGREPESGVVDANLAIHGAPNVHVLGSSVFVTGGAAHPTLAICALAHRLASHLLAELPTMAAPG